MLSIACALSTLSCSAWDYPVSRRSDHVDTYHGHNMPDPYRWLEDLDSPETVSWVEAQNKLTQPFLKALPQREAIRERLTLLWNYERFGVTSKQGSKYFVMRNSGLQNQAVLLVQPSLTAEPRILLDPNTLSADGTVALSEFSPSPDGKLLGYGTAASGSDWNEYRVRDIASGKDTADLLRWVKFSGFAWTYDAQGFYYSRYPEPVKDSATGKTFGALENQRLYYHRLGTAQSADLLIKEVADQPSWFVGGSTSDDGRFLMISVSKGSSNENLVSFSDLGDPSKPKLDAPITTLVDKWEAEFSFIGNVGPVLYFVTNLEAPRKRIIAVDSRKPGRENWKPVVAESSDTLESAYVAGDKLVLLTMHDAASRLQVYALDGKSVGEIALPTIGSVSGISAKSGDPELFFSFTSFTYPTSNYRCDLTDLSVRVLNSPKVGFTPSDYETKQVFYTSKDGTRVPMFITHRKGLVLDGKTPTLLYGYGGFDVSLTPAFSISNLAWMDMGGIYAVPNLRGGGEYGKAWHEAGTKEKKQNVFDDFIAAAEYLVKEHYTNPGQLVLSGGSNGGLLVAAVVNQRPDLCRVALPAVGVMDMLRFHKFTIGHAWVSDYGSSDDPKGFEYLKAYSPVHTVKARAHYPAMLITTADHDDRVYPAHTYKYTATLQQAVFNGADSLPVLVRIETKAGHGAGKPTSKVIEESADKLAFAKYFLSH